MKEQGYTKLIGTDPLAGNYFLKQIIGGAFITIAMTGLDQEMMQKNISVTNLKDSQKNMMTMSVLQVGVVFIFLSLGGLLALYATANGVTATGDDLFPAIAVKSGLPFIITVCFLIGLVSALFPSADGALTALTSSFCIDILGMKKRAEWNEEKRKKVRLIVHNVFAIIFLICVFFFREVDNGSLIQTLLVVAGYTYGPLLALFSFGILTKRKVYEGAVPIISLLAPVVCYMVKQNEKEWLGGYIIGTELLIINAGLAFILLLLCSKKSDGVLVSADHERTTNENQA
jgi:Na+/proline symporter